MAVNYPKGGEINLMMIPDMRYQAIIIAGPSYPTSSASFYVKRIISRTGLVKLR
jgi:hypothetical protein